MLFYLDSCYLFVFIYNNTNESRGVAAADVAFKLLLVTIVRLAIQVSIGNAFSKRSMYSRRLIGLKEKLGFCPYTDLLVTIHI